MEDIQLTRQQAIDLCESIELDGEFFDEDNEEFTMLRDGNPELLSAYEVIFTIAYSDEDQPSDELLDAAEYTRRGRRLAELSDKLKWVYCKERGADSIIGLDSCDDYRDWLEALAA